MKTIAILLLLNFVAIDKYQVVKNCSRNKRSTKSFNTGEVISCKHVERHLVIFYMDLKLKLVAGFQNVNQTNFKFQALN